MRVAVIAASVLAVVASPAAFAGIVCTDPSAGCLSIAAPITPVLEFAPAPGGALSVSTLDPGGFQGVAAYNASDGTLDSGGTAVFGPMSFTTGALAPPPPPFPAPVGVQYFPASGAETFIYQALDGDVLDMSIAWSSVVPNAPLGEPQLFGIGTITALAGDDIFTSDFGAVGSMVDIGANFPLSGSCDLTVLASGACSATFELAAFEGADATFNGGTPLHPHDVPGVPEPSTLLLLGGALLGLGLWYEMGRRSGRRWVI